MDFDKVFKDHDIVKICSYLIKYCETYICSPTISTEHGSAFHSFLPTVLTCIFGSPAVRGWFQTDTKPDQDKAIRNLLDPQGYFMASLIKLSTRPEFSYDMSTERFPEDIRRALTSEAIQYLPRVYENCAYLDISKVTKSLDLRSSATRQSSVFPRPSKGVFRIRFNMIQFYLYYMVSMATWPPLTPSQSLSQPTSNSINSKNPTYPVTNSINNNTSTSSNNNSTYSSTNSPNNNISAYPTTGSTISSTYSSSSNSSSTYPTTSTSSTNNNLAYQIPGQLRSTHSSIYPELIQHYMRVYIPCVVNDNAPYTNGIGTFFLDSLVELWIRTVWISPSQKISMEFTKYLMIFLKYIVGGDLRRCASYRNFNTIKVSEYTNIYHIIKDELYLLISRLSLNWRKQDDYIWVLNLWSIWAAPWRFGNVTIISGQPEQTRDTSGLLDLESSPIDEGWAYFILENGWFYFTLVNSFLQKISTFTYPDKAPSPPTFLPPSTSNPTTSGNRSTFNRPMYSTGPSSPIAAPSRPMNPLDGSSVTGELNILRQLIDMWKTRGLLDYLSMLEDGLESVAEQTNTIANTDSTLTPSSYGPAFSSFLHNAQSRLNSALASLPASVNPHRHHDMDTFISLSRVCCISDGTDTTGIRLQLQLLQDRILSITPTNPQQQWTPINIYSTHGHHRSENLVKALEGLDDAVDKRQNPNGKSLVNSATSWTSSMLGQKKEPPNPMTVAAIKSLSSMAMELSTLLKLPLPDRSKKVVANVMPPTTAPSTGSVGKADTKKDDERKDTQEQLRTSERQRLSIKALGPLTEEIVQSYESRLLVSWIVPLDRRVNAMYRRWLWSPSLPDRITFRWFAVPVNLIYFILLLASLYVYSFR